jgi:hypothetical protein
MGQPVFPQSSRRISFGRAISGSHGAVSTSGCARPGRPTHEDSVGTCVTEGAGRGRGIPPGSPLRRRARDAERQRIPKEWIAKFVKEFQNLAFDLGRLRRSRCVSDGWEGQFCDRIRGKHTLGFLDYIFRARRLCSEIFESYRALSEVLKKTERIRRNRNSKLEGGLRPK